MNRVVQSRRDKASWNPRFRNIFQRSSLNKLFEVTIVECIYFKSRIKKVVLIFMEDSVGPSK